MAATETKVTLDSLRRSIGDRLEAAKSNKGQQPGVPATLNALGDVLAELPADEVLRLTGLLIASARKRKS